MSIRDAAEAAQTQAVEQRKGPTPAEKLKRAIDIQTKEFKAVLPKGMDADQFGRQVLSAVKTTPKLMTCFDTDRGKSSILLAAMQAGTMGLMPNTPAQEAWLLPRRVSLGRDQFVDECELQIGYRGYLKLIRNAGGIETVYAEAVREGDEFEYSRGLKEDVLRHVPSGNESGELKFAYAVVRYLNGGYQFIVLGREAVHARRDKSTGYKSKYNSSSPWITAEAAMWRKSAIRALVPFLELSPEAHSAIDSDEKTFKRDEDGEIVTDEPTWIDTIATPVNDDVRIDLTEQAEAPKQVEAPMDVIDVTEEQPSPDHKWLELLKVLMREQMITGNGRWDKVLEVTGMQPRAWQDITEAMAEETCKALDSSASI